MNEKKFKMTPAQWFVLISATVLLLTILGLAIVFVLQASHAINQDVGPISAPPPQHNPGGYSRIGVAPQRNPAGLGLCHAINQAVGPILP